MDTLFALLARRGYVVLAAFVVAEQVPPCWLPNQFVQKRSRL